MNLKKEICFTSVIDLENYFEIFKEKAWKNFAEVSVLCLSYTCVFELFDGLYRAVEAEILHTILPIFEATSSNWLSNNF